MQKALVALIISSFILLLQNTPSLANLVDDLENLIGYSVIASKTVDGDFEGCDYDKVIVFTDGTALSCDEYSYTYTYRPKVIILAKDRQNIRMVVGDKVFRMKSLR